MPPPGWPQHGRIEFKDVSLSYEDPDEAHPEGDPDEAHPEGEPRRDTALKRISFSVEPGSRVVRLGLGLRLGVGVRLGLGLGFRLRLAAKWYNGNALALTHTLTRTLTRTH